MHPVCTKYIYNTKFIFNYMEECDKKLNENQNI